MSTQVSITDPAVADKILAVAKREERTVSAQVTRALREWLADQEGGQPPAAPEAF